MYNNPFFMNGYNPTITNANLMRGLPTSAIANTTRNTGLFQRLGSSLAGIRKINWGGLINNTSKTLGIINQTIPIVRQVGPMVNNMRSMIKVASIFKDETDTTRNTPPKKINQTTLKKETINPPQTPNNLPTKNEDYNESPTFFINT